MAKSGTGAGRKGAGSTGTDPETPTSPGIAPSSTAASADAVAPNADVENPGPSPEGPPTEAAKAGSNDAATSETAPQTAPDTALMPEVSAETTPPVMAAAPAAQPARCAGIALFFGGVSAAAIGAAAVLWLFPHGWQPAEPVSDPAIEGRISALESQLSTLPSPPPAPDLTPITERLETLENAPPPDLGTIETRLAALEAGSSSPSADADFEARIEALIESRVEAVLAEARRAQNQTVEVIEAAREDLAEAEARLAQRAALAQLTAAADTGAPAAEALSTLPEHPGLNAFADGLPSLGTLQASFAPAARAALAAAPATETGEGATDRLLGFLRIQTGARSLTPREGQSTDAVLSRAEARLQAQDLPATLAELDALTEGPALAMAEWRARAEARVAGLQALDHIRAALDD